VNPKASIIILDYLKSRRVEKNVESIYTQKTEVPFEVIIVDNSCDPKNAQKLESAVRMVEGTARSMGIEIQ